VKGALGIGEEDVYFWGMIRANASFF